MQIDVTGHVQGSTVYPAMVQNRAKLTFEAVNTWLDGAAPESLTPESREAWKRIQKTPRIQSQVRLQDTVSRLLLLQRAAHGTLFFDLPEPRMDRQSDGTIDIKVLKRSRASGLVEEQMVTANQAVAAYLEQKRFPRIERVVRRPERWRLIVEMAERYGFWLPDMPDGTALQTFMEKRGKADPASFPALARALIMLMGGGTYVLVSPAKHRPVISPWAS